MADPGFWNDSQQAQETSQRLARLRENVERWGKMQSQSEDIETLLELSEEEDDESVYEEIRG